MEIADNLRCEHLISPAGIDNPYPRFSWATRVEQTGYRIQVRGMWDSGMIHSVRRFAVYCGSGLAPQSIYHWRVGIETASGFEWSSWTEFETGFFTLSDWNASWIAYSWAHVPPEEQSVNFVRKEFTVSDLSQVVRARLYVAATAGFSGNDTLRMNLYQVRLNGGKVGSDLFNPGQLSRDRRRALYRTYDILALLREGGNAIGVVFAAELISFEILLKYADGHCGHVFAGDGCKFQTRGPYLRLWRHDVYEYGGKGEHYDAGAEFTGWDLSGFDDSKWKPVRGKGYAPGVLAAQLQSVTVFETLKPRSLRSLPDGTHIVDFGRAMNGHVRIAVHGGKRGDCIRLSFAEAVSADGFPNYESTLSSQKMKSMHEDIYCKRGTETEVYAPSFANHGFRYVLITGYPGTPAEEDVTANAVSSEVLDRVEFTTSDPLLEGLFRLAKNSFRSNLMSVCTDCPSRERQGWSADAACCSDALNAFFDMELFVEKWMRDVADSQFADGSLPYVVPFPDVLRGPDVPWCTGFLQVVADTYLANGDPALLEAVYPVFFRWCEFLERIAEADGLSRGYSGYGDHMGEGCVNHVFLENVFALRSFTLQKQFAGWLGKTSDSVYLEHLVQKKKNALRQVVQLSESCFAERVLILASGLAEGEEGESLWRSLRQELESRLCIPTGYLATRPLMEQLTERGELNLAWKLIRSSRSRTWRNWLENGLTTAPESWEFQRGSLNHAALAGPMGAWLIRALGGIVPLEPGGRKVRLTPFFPDGIRDLSIRQSTPLGTLGWSWNFTGECHRCQLTVPYGMTILLNDRCFSAGEYTLENL